MRRPTLAAVSRPLTAAERHRPDSVEPRALCLPSRHLWTAGKAETEKKNRGRNVHEASRVEESLQWCSWCNRGCGRGRSGTAQRARSPELPIRPGSTSGLQAARHKEGARAETSTKPPTRERHNSCSLWHQPKLHLPASKEPRAPCSLAAPQEPSQKCGCLCVKLTAEPLPARELRGEARCQAQKTKAR